MRDYEEFEGGLLPKQMTEAATAVWELLAFLEERGDNYCDEYGYDVDVDVDDEFHVSQSVLSKALIENEIRILTEKFARDVKRKIELYKGTCLPVIEQDTPIPEPIRDRSNDFFEAMALDGGGGRRGYTASDFVEAITESVYDFLPSYLYDDDETFDFEDDDEEEEGEGYGVMDSDRDTEEETENILRLFPDVLEDCPKLFFCTNLKAVEFIPLIARLRMELCEDLDEDERGGLLSYIPRYGANALQRLVIVADTDESKSKKQQRPQPVYYDDRLVAVLKRLKEMGLLRKEDIREQDLLFELCYSHHQIWNSNSSSVLFQEKRFRFLVDWYPDLLARPDTDLWNGRLLLQYAASYCSLRGFQLVFQAGLWYFRKKRGIRFLFHKGYNGNNNNDGNDDGTTDGGEDSPFTAVCKSHGREDAMAVIEDTLANCSAGECYDTEEALLSAAVDDNTTLDGVYFLLRREPDVLQKLLLPSASSSSSPTATRKRKRSTIRDSDEDEDDTKQEAAENKNQEQQQPVNNNAEDDNDVLLTLAEQEFLCETIPNLSPDQLYGVIGIIREAFNLTDDDVDEIDLDIEQLEPSTQRRIWRHVAQVRI